MPTSLQSRRQGHTHTQREREKGFHPTFERPKPSQRAFPPREMSTSPPPPYSAVVGSTSITNTSTGIGIGIGVGKGNSNVISSGGGTKRVRQGSSPRILEEGRETGPAKRTAVEGTITAHQEAVASSSKVTLDVERQSGPSTMGSSPVSILKQSGEKKDREVGLSRNLSSGPPLLSPISSSSVTTHWPQRPFCSLDLHGRAVSYWGKRTPKSLQKPERLTSFSYDVNRRLFHDDRAMKFYHLPPLGADLNRGYGQYIQRDETRNEHLDSLLYALMNLAEHPNGDEVRQRSDVITWRGMATKLCTALYEERDSFEMNAMLVNGTLYLEEWTDPEAKAAKLSKEANDKRLRKFSYYGYSFESWCTSSNPAFNPTYDDPWDGDVNTNVQWCSIVKTRLGPLRLILGGEVDCVDADTLASVELKTSMAIRSQEDEVRFEKKMLRFYMQSFLLGIDSVVVGFRDRDGILKTTHTFKTLEMPRNVRGKPHAWDPNACLNMAAAILAFVKDRIQESLDLDTTSHADQQAASPPPKERSDPPVFRIYFSPPYSGIRLQRLTKDQVAQIKGSDVSRAGFLPRDYYDFATQRSG